MFVIHRRAVALSHVKKRETSMRKIAVVGALCALAVACDAPRVITAVEDAKSAAGVSGTEEHGTARLAQAIALAMHNDDLRHQLRDAWRDSRVSTDHKLVLSDFLATDVGARLLDEMVRNSGSSKVDLLAIMAALPDLDFYVPIRAHRESWAGTEDVLVAATLDQNVDRVTAYSTTGTAVRVEGKDAAAGAPLVVLHPAEPKYPVMGHQRYSAGDRIQLPLEQAYPDAKPVHATNAESDLGTARLLATGVYVDWFDTWRDDGLFGGDLEMEFRSRGYENGTPYNAGSFFIYPTPTCTKGTGTGNFPANPPVTSSVLVSPGLTSATLNGCGTAGYPQGYSIHAWEMDFGPGAEDDFGMRFTSSGSLPYGLSISTTISYQLFYSFPGTTSGQKSLNLGLIFH